MLNDSEIHLEFDRPFVQRIRIRRRPETVTVYVTMAEGYPYYFYRNVLESIVTTIGKDYGDPRTEWRVMEESWFRRTLFKVRNWLRR